MVLTRALEKTIRMKATGRSYDLELPYLNLSSDKNPVLSFDYQYGFIKACPQCLDELTVLVSKDCGKTLSSNI
jgi:hypothetical protein